MAPQADQWNSAFPSLQLDGQQVAVAKYNTGDDIEVSGSPATAPCGVPAARNSRGPMQLSGCFAVYRDQSKGSPVDTILVSNRVIDPMRGGAMPGGLAAALSTAVRESGATWIGGSSERQTTDYGAVSVTPFGKGSLAKVNLPPAVYRQFYDGMANSALWPILHCRTDLLRYQPEFLAAYNAINGIMADGVRRIASSDNALIWVHDYHCFVLGRRLRQRGMCGPIGFFLHTPFPHRSILTCLPCHSELLRELCAYDLIGFQTEEDLLHFRDYAITDLFATVTDENELSFGGCRVQLGVFPIGIDVERFADAAKRAITSVALKRLRHTLAQSRLVIGVDRLDYSKGLVHRFHAYQRFFSDYPDERRRVSFLQITPPTRERVKAYRNIRLELASIAGEINARFSGAAWVALRYIHEGFAPERLAGYYRLGRVGCVTPLRDGMNLVAKEYVASQDPDDPGVLVLSKFAGAASQMGAALVVNPYDTSTTARCIHEALYMPKEERVERWTTLMRMLRASSLDGWFTSFVGALRARSLGAARRARLSVA